MMKVSVKQDCVIGNDLYFKGAKIEMKESVELYYLEVDGKITIERENDLFGGKSE